MYIRTVCVLLWTVCTTTTMYHTSLMLREYVVEARFEHVSYIVKNAPDWLLKLWKYISLILRAHVNWLTGIQYSDLCRSRIWTRVVAEIRERNIVQNAPDWRMEIFSLILRAYVYGPLQYHDKECNCMTLSVSLVHLIWMVGCWGICIIAYSAITNQTYFSRQCFFKSIWP